MLELTENKTPKKCIFCGISTTSPEILYEGLEIIAKLDAIPTTPYHTILIPKKHIVRLEDITDQGWIEILAIIKNFRNLISTKQAKEAYNYLIKSNPGTVIAQFCQDTLTNPFLKLKPKAFNLGVNNGREAGRTVDHLHIHIIPRFKGDVENPVGGVRAIFPQKADYTKPPEKLVRDKVPDVVESQGQTLQWRLANSEELLGFLKAKFSEEVAEVFKAKNPKDLREELADLLELIRFVGLREGITLDEIISTSKQKRQEKGSFERTVILKTNYNSV